MSTISNDSLVESMEDIYSPKLLVQQAKQGCLDSFHQLVMDHQQLVRLYLARRLGKDAEIEDLSQEVFVVAFQRLGTFRADSQFSTWLIGIARNKLMQHLRECVRQRHRNRDFADIALQRLEQASESQDLVEEQAQYLAALRSCLGELPEDSRCLIDQFYFEKKPSHEIAQAQQRSSGAIRMKLMRLRELLQKCILTKTASH
ncbi:MAG: sigma-70 family RNA polymerase sigma factor [Planctomycetota bacterium]